MIYRDRIDAGKQLAARLSDYANRDDVLVLALPRGGVPVAYEVAKALRSPLDIFLVRKLGVPGQDEVADMELRELERRERAYRGDRPEPKVQGKTVILIDDGLATGSTMRAAAKALRQQDPARIVVAVPVSAAQTCDEYRMGVDEIICARMPEPFMGVGMWYRDFSQTTDEEVREILARAENLNTTELKDRELVHS